MSKQVQMKLINVSIVYEYQSGAEQENYDGSNNRHGVSIRIMPTVHSCTFSRHATPGRSSSYLQLYGIPQDPPTYRMCTHSRTHSCPQQVLPIRLFNSSSAALQSNFYMAQGQSHPHKSRAALFPVFRRHQIPWQGSGVATDHRHCASLARCLCLPSSSPSHGLKMFLPMFV
jgi:hypothetical protein